MMVYHKHGMWRIIHTIYVYNAVVMSNVYEHSHNDMVIEKYITI